MADKNKNNYIWIGIIVIVAIGIFGIWQFSKPSITGEIINEDIRNSNTLNQEQESQIEKNTFDINVDFGDSTNYYNGWENLNAISGSRVSAETGEKMGDFYGGLWLALFTDNNKESITCYIEEYYDSKFNSQFTMELSETYANDDNVKMANYENIGYEANKKPNEVRYDIECKGLESRYEVKKTIFVDIEYPIEYSDGQIKKCEEDWHGGWDSRNQCYHAEAQNKGDYDYCLQIEDNEKKDTCLLFVSYSTDNTYVCELISTDSGCTHSNGLNCRDSCYWDYAQEHKEAYYCDSIEDDTGQGTCYMWIASDKNKPNLCSNIRKTSGDWDRDQCYYSTAVQNSNIDICNPIEDTEDHDQCMMVIIRDLKLDDISLCNKMTTDWKHSCKYEISTGNYIN